MSVSHVVVDGSNIATEGRTLPSLQQLDDAVRAFLEQYSPETVTVVVDATFPNRVESEERPAFEEAILNGELVTPPAGAIGRGDAFLLEIADRAGATVLSNDSFQEFHGQFEWLFDQGRLIGGKPVPHVGWVFMDRAPVRGPLSRKSVSDARKAARKKPATKKASEAKPAKKAKRATKKAAKKAAPSKRRADATRTDTHAADAALVAEGGRRRRGRGRTATDSPLEPYNEPMPFIEFVARHPLGSTVEGVIERFSSHGAYVLAAGARCYLPLKHMADPPPRSAREVLTVGETYPFVIQAFDTPRRGVDLAIPGVVPLPPDAVSELAPTAVGARGTAGETHDQPTEEDRVAPAKKATRKSTARKKAGAKKAPARKKSTAKRSTARKASARKKSTARKSTARKSTAKRSAKKAPARKKSTARKSTAKRSAKKAPARKRSTAKRATKRATKRR